jgi:hypothetical protein
VTTLNGAEQPRHRNSQFFQEQNRQKPELKVAIITATVLNLMFPSKIFNVSHTIKCMRSFVIGLNNRLKHFHMPIEKP